MDTEKFVGPQEQADIETDLGIKSEETEVEEKVRKGEAVEQEIDKAA